MLSTTLATGCGWIDKAAAKDTKVVVYSAGPATSVAIDGGEAVELGAGKFQSFAVGPGTHELVFDGSRKVSVTLEAFDRWVVPAAADQCFFSIDVSSSHYSADGKNRLGGPDITKRQQQSEPFKFPPQHYLTEKELPAEVSSGTLLYMLRSLPCDELDRLEAGLDGSPTSEPAPPADPTLARLVEFSAAIGCDAPEGVAKAWCVAAGAWTHVDDAKLPLPDTGKSYVGLRVEIPADGELASVLDGAKLSLLAIRPEAAAGFGTLSGVNPENDDERQELDAAMASVRAVFTGDAKAVELRDGIGAYVDTLPASAATSLTATERGWTIGDGEAELRAAGPLVVALEHDGAGNLALSFHLPR
ncbi:hypothetical protein [Enhygromyxa salina]|uniref:Uncharacterized protein n=1 Tax=Enhygromyxa salina TaxID=215803 RepID=A0A2S9XTK2_9BACT|nr:hypothetical protein [Enhygromyxa salina]PRP96173.1 hypothetical protein ENSA7_69870 [Enhygromyxa salina]